MDEEESNQDSLKVSKKRKGRILNISKEADAKEDKPYDKEEGEEDKRPVQDVKEFDSEENDPKKVVKYNDFEEKGKHDLNGLWALGALASTTEITRLSI